MSDIHDEDDDLGMPFTAWMAMNPETCVPELVVPFSAYEELEALHNQAMANAAEQLTDYRHAHMLAKDAIELAGLEKTRLMLKVAALEIELQALQKLLG